MRNKVLVGGIIGALLLLFFGTRSIVNKVNGTTFNELITIEEEVKIDKPYEKINLSTTNAKVEFIPTQAETTTVSYGGKKKSRVNFEAKVKGDTLSVRLKEKRFNFFSFSMKGMVLKVYVPERAYQEIKAETDNGIIEASHLLADTIELKTDNGLVKLENSEGEFVKLNTDNGQISIRDVHGNVAAETDNGRIIYKADELNHDVDLRTDNGAIHVELSKKPGNARIEASTDNGVVTIFGTKERSATFGDGKYLMKLRTDNGKIQVSE